MTLLATVAGVLVLCARSLMVWDRRQRRRLDLAAWEARQRVIALTTADVEWPVAPACSRSLLVQVTVSDEVLELPVARGWDEHSILTTLAEIEAL